MPETDDTRWLMDKPLQTTLATAHFNGKVLPIARVLTALAGQENTDGDEGRAMQCAGELLHQLFVIVADAPELNMANYNHDDLSALNQAMIDIWRALREATFAP